MTDLRRLAIDIWSAAKFGIFFGVVALQMLFVIIIALAVIVVPCLVLAAIGDFVWGLL